MITSSNPQSARRLEGTPISGQLERSNSGRPRDVFDGGDQDFKCFSSISQHQPVFNFGILGTSDAREKEDTTITTSPACGPQDSYATENDLPRGVRKTASLRRGAAGYNQLLQAAVMASIETRKGIGNLDGDDDDVGVVGVPAPPPPSPDLIAFARSQSSSGTSRDVVPFKVCDMGASPFGDGSSNRKNKRSRNHEQHDDDGDERMLSLARTCPLSKRSLENDGGDFDDYDDTAMDQDMMPT